MSCRRFPERREQGIINQGNRRRKALSGGRDHEATDRHDLHMGRVRRETPIPVLHPEKFKKRNFRTGVRLPSPPPQYPHKWEHLTKD